MELISISSANCAALTRRPSRSLVGATAVERPSGDCTAVRPCFECDQILSQGAGLVQLDNLRVI
jgi:hypothetical protein